MEYIIEERERVVNLKRLKGHKISVVEARIPERIVIGQVAVQGMITDTTGAPLIGVSVALKGRASVGTSTDLNGRFVLEIPEDGVLIFSMIGFETQEVTVNGRTERSEEHTSELQSLMRISYAVFCLKKKNNNNTAN